MWEIPDKFLPRHPTPSHILALRHRRVDANVDALPSSKKTLNFTNFIKATSVPVSCSKGLLVTNTSSPQAVVCVYIYILYIFMYMHTSIVQRMDVRVQSKMWVGYHHGGIINGVEKGGELC